MSVILFFFIYTTALLVICIMALSVCGAAFLVSHSKRYILRSLFFVFYALELSWIFGTEWMAQHVITIDESNYYAIGNPWAAIPMGAAILACFWATALDMVDIHGVRTIVLPTALVMAAQAVVLAALPYGPLRQWLYYSMRQAFLIGCLLYGFHLYRSSRDTAFRQRMVQHRQLFVTILALTCCILLEDVYVILLAPVPDASGSFAGLFLSTRNFSENALMVYLAWYVCREAIRDLSLRYLEPPASQPMDDKGRDLRGHIESRILTFAAHHGLSRREREVLGLVMEGRTNHEVAGTLYLAEGTIKAHVHNIMKKCGCSRREELQRAFWAS